MTPPHTVSHDMMHTLNVQIRPYKIPDYICLYLQGLHYLSTFFTENMLREYVTYFSDVSCFFAYIYSDKKQKSNQFFWNWFTDSVRNKS